jgi:hypothetical protein
MASLLMGVLQVFGVLWWRGKQCDSGGARCLDAVASAGSFSVVQELPLVEQATASTARQSHGDGGIDVMVSLCCRW